MDKIIIFLLFVTMGYSQNTVISFFYGTENTLGAEVLTQIKGTESFYLGGGFGGVLTQNRAKNNENWCDIYAVTSFGYIGSVMIKERAGILTTISNNAKDVDYKPLIGISAMYGITKKNYGIELGIDTFNKITIGFCAVF